MPDNEQILMGTATALMCALGLWKSQWLLENTRKGQRLQQALGLARAIWVLRGLLLLGMMGGILLAVNVLRPMQW